MAMHAARKRGRHTEAEWEVVVYLAGNMCLQCLRSGTKTRITKDHIVPVCAGGSDDIMNLQPLCHECNGQKGFAIQDLRGSALRNAIRAATEDVPVSSRKLVTEPPLTWSLADKLGAALAGRIV